MKNFDRGLLIVSTLVTVFGVIVTLLALGITFLPPAPLVDSATAATQPGPSTTAQKPDAAARVDNSVPSPASVVSSDPVSTSSESQRSDSHHSGGRAVKYVEEYIEEDSDDTVECQCVCPTDDEESEDDSETEPAEPPPLSFE